jgi:hypothetical protein
MKYGLDQIVKFKDGEYIILDVVNHNDNTYLYMINNSEFMDDVSIVKVLENGELDYINDESEFDYVINRIFLDNQVDLIYLTQDE